MAVIESLLDTDLYKLTMMQAILHHFPRTVVEYTFKCRVPGIDFSDAFDDIREEIDHLCTLRFRDDELDYLSRIPFFKSDFIDFLSLFHLNGRHLDLRLREDGMIDLKIRGSWVLTILFEVPVLAIISEVYFRHYYKKLGKSPDYVEARRRLIEKIDLMNSVKGFRFADFGTRRRFSRKWHEEIIGILVERSKGGFVGTSNVYFAKKYRIRPIGTMAHEWLQAGQATDVKLVDSQKYMLQKWVDEYRGDLGIALSDVINFDAFLVDFDKYFAKLYDGVRFDSGDPFVDCQKLIDHYKRLKIDPKTKTAVFSDGLSFEKAVKILERFGDQINVSFGIGTNLTNDFPDHDPLDIVIKMTRCNNLPVAKLSDSPNKMIYGDKNYMLYLKSVFDEKIRKYKEELKKRSELPF